VQQSERAADVRIAQSRQPSLPIVGQSSDVVAQRAAGVFSPLIVMVAMASPSGKP